MKIHITSDVFDVCKRIKTIDGGYEIYFDTKLNSFVAYHNGMYALNLGKYLNAGVLDVVRYTRIENSAKLFDVIEKNNQKITQKQNEQLSDYSNYAFKEIYSYANSHSNNIDFSNIKLF